MITAFDCFVSHDIPYIISPIIFRLEPLWDFSSVISSWCPQTIEDWLDLFAQTILNIRTFVSVYCHVRSDIHTTLPQSIIHDVDIELIIDE